MAKIRPLDLGLKPKRAEEDRRGVDPPVRGGGRASQVIAFISAIDGFWVSIARGQKTRKLHRFGAPLDPDHNLSFRQSATRLRGIRLRLLIHLDASLLTPAPESRRLYDIL